MQRHRRLPTRAARCHTERADYLDGSMNAIKRWYAETHQPRAAAPARRPTSIDGMDLFIGLSGARVMPAEALARMNARRDGLRDGQPDARGHARGGGAVRADHGHRAARTTPTRSTTSSRFPGIFRGALDVRARADHRGDEAGRRAGDRRDRRRATSCARTTSSPRSSTATSRPRSPPRWPSRRKRAGRRDGARGDTIGFAAIDARADRGPTEAGRAAAT